MSPVLAELAYWQQSTLKVLLVLVAVLLPAGAFVQLFLFKMVSHLQARLGPMEAGPHGSLQALAEITKFIQKEDIVPAKADRLVFKLAPFIVFVTVPLVYFAVPFGPDAVFANLDAGVFYVLAVSSISVIGVLIAGWSSANKYSLMGAIRAAGQLIAYELPMVLAVVGVVIQAGTMNLQGIVFSQADGEIFGFGAVGNPYFLTQAIGLFIFLIAMQAELTQTPFDMPVAESELVTGYMTEYSGLRFLLFFLAEFAAVGAFGAVASTLWLGGWYLPGLDLDANYMNLVGPAILFGKIMFIAFLVFWVRFTYPRFREDQLQMFAWKYLIPLSLINIVATAVLKVVF
ncbi:MAG TPA: complex I subunit 1 family protein [Nocardioidaceae bacterium]|nr:complex I subunit 1 family protein [Nocardioidaceae bacterium]